jgi:hypothetical protein
MSVESAPQEPSKEKKQPNNGQRGSFLASWLSKRGDTLLDAKELKEETSHEVTGSKGNFKQAWNKLFDKIGVQEQIGEEMPELMTVAKKADEKKSATAVKMPAVPYVHMIPSQAIEKQADNSDNIAKVSSEYRGELYVGHMEDAAKKAQENGAGAETKPKEEAVAVQLPEIEQRAASPLPKRREYAANPFTDRPQAIDNNSDEKTVSRLRQERIINPVDRSLEQTADMPEDLMKDIVLAADVNAPIERIYERSHEVKDQDAHGSSSATPLGDILAAHPVAANVPSVQDPAAIEPAKAELYSLPTVNQSTPSQEPMVMFTPDAPKVTSVTTPMPIYSLPPSNVSQPTPSPLWQIPEPKPDSDKYRQAVVNGFWGGIVVVFIMTVFYLFT